MTMPNFLVIGGAKCGTDSLCNYLGQHPQVFMCPNREPNYFVAEGQGDIPYRGPGDRRALTAWDMWVSTQERYEALFADVTDQKAIGEGTTWYLYDKDAPRRIYQQIPEARIIAILRNPVDRAYSAYTMLLRDGRESISDFSDALAAEDQRIRSGWEPMWHYRAMGFYAAQLRRYYSLFDPRQIHIVLYDDFNARASDIIRELFQFLEVDTAFTPDTSTRYNVSLVPKHPLYHSLLMGENPLKLAAKSILPADFRQRIKGRLVSRNLAKPTPLDPQIRANLVEVFRSDILELQELIGRDLSTWLT